MKLILKSIWYFICGLFISDKECELQSENELRKETQSKNKSYLAKYSGKKRYVKTPSY